MAGDYPHALGNIHTIESPYFPNSFYPEADILKAVIYFANCQYDDGDHHRRASSRRSTSRSTTTSSKVLDRFKGDEPGGAVLQVPEGRARRQGATSRRRIKPVVENALSRSPAPPQHRVRARPRRGAEALQEGARRASTTRRSATTSRTRCSSRATSRFATPVSSPASATSATSTSSTSTSATARRSSSTSPLRSATSSTRRSPAVRSRSEESEDVRHREARRRARHLAVRRRVLA